MFGRTSPPSDPTRPAETANGPRPGGFIPARETPPAMASTGSFTPPAVPDASKPQVATSVIGKDLHIAGDKIIIICQSRLQVDGEIVGDLVGREVIIGETASVTGAVSAEAIEVRGRVSGSVKGMNVALKPSARVEGDILHQVLSIAEGAHFDGRVRRANDASEVRPPLDVTKAPKTA